MNNSEIADVHNCIQILCTFTQSCFLKNIRCTSTINKMETWMLRLRILRKIHKHKERNKKIKHKKTHLQQISAAM